MIPGLPWITTWMSPLFPGNNEGRNPVEYLLVAVRMSHTSLVAHASAGESRYGEYDRNMKATGPPRLLGISEDVPVGIRISVYFEIDADVSDDKRRDGPDSPKYSPCSYTHEIVPFPCI